MPEQSLDNLTPSVNSSKKIFLPIIVVALLAAVGALAYFGLGSSASKFLGFSRPTAKPFATSKVQVRPTVSPNFTGGLKIAQNNIATYSDSKLLTKTTITQDFYGKLKSFEADKSWTIVRGGKTVVLHPNVNVKVEYFNAAKESIGPNDLKVGDTVSVRAVVDSTSGLMYVKSITVKTKAPVATQAPTTDE